MGSVAPVKVASTAAAEPVEWLMRTCRWCADHLVGSVSRNIAAGVPDDQLPEQRHLQLQANSEELGGHVAQWHTHTHTHLVVICDFMTHNPENKKHLYATIFIISSLYFFILFSFLLRQALWRAGGGVSEWESNIENKHLLVSSRKTTYLLLSSRPSCVTDYLAAK